jgi:hypothetical protein
MTDLDPKAFKANAAPKSVALKAIDSVALARLVEEVRNTGGEAAADTSAYNRTYHRHNR